MSERRSVVLVTLDSLRADHVTPELMPTLSRLAAEGVDYRTAIAPGPSTYESMPAIWTGRPMRAFDPVGGDALDERGHTVWMNTRGETLPQWFADAGYRTGAFTTNPFTASFTNFARGFETFEDFLGEGEGRLMEAAGHVPVLSELKHLVTLARGDRASKPWQEYYDDVRAWLAADDGRPYFLWLFALDTHTPFLAPREFRTRGALSTYYHNWTLWAGKKWGIDRHPDREALLECYAATCRSADAFLARLLADLPGDPVLAVHADHGEAFGEHGAWGHDGPLYEEHLHVPFVVHGAGQATVEAPVSLVDLGRVLRLAASGDPPVLTPSPESVVVARTLGPKRLAYRGARWKAIVDCAGLAPGPESAFAPARNGQGPATDGTGDARASAVELYDLRADPGEREDLARTHPDLVTAVRTAARRRLAHERETAAITRVVGAL